ncbi:SIP3 [Candida pseudojiufengensis]|uniref:SIP3 n=1 Tax=Candida pseudojiufengensis TaxID=497109 RepID=UPI002225589D|nr:SIP3 [Candida pseudojiufengensis]KAI5966266.1 SIP3 [Candida pseudojiufengensis]
MSQSNGQSPQNISTIGKSNSIRSNNGNLNNNHNHNQSSIIEDSNRTLANNNNETPIKPIQRDLSQRSIRQVSQSTPNTTNSNQIRQQRQYNSNRLPLNSPSPGGKRASQSPNPTNDSKQHLIRQFKLISVNFKEAALDSPSFRASTNHLDLQINNIEQWLIALNSSIKKIPKYVKEVEIFCNSFLEHLVPNFLQDGMIDQEYTVKSLYASLDGFKTIWTKSLFSLTTPPQILNDLNNFRKIEISNYKELRNKFLIYQKKYDKYLSIFVSTSKTKDAIMVLEDAKQLYEVRKEYIHISLELIVELQNLSQKLDRLLVCLNTNLWQKKWSHFANDNLYNYNNIKESWDMVQKVQAWSDSYSIAIDKLKYDMISAKIQVEESSFLQFQPSNNIHDYNVNIINYKSLQDINELSFEKHGYLFMKTFIEKSNKPKWEKRWCFIKNGVFGMLVLSPNQTSVQESDKFGIILCNLRYSPNEDRRFCFELKTSENNLILQAESLIELKSWLKVFANERNRITSLSPNDPLFIIASNRYPPIFSEFASTINTLKDQEISNLKIINSNNEIIISSSLSKFLEIFDKEYDSKWYYKLPQVFPPILTETTKLAIVAYSTIRATELPTALTANIWGSVNWGLYYLKDRSSLGNNNDNKLKNFQIRDEEMIKFQQLNTNNTIPYPSFYPNELISLDIQMRALFENIIEPGEYCLMSFGCIWSPNSKQELSGRCFLTNYHTYFYMQALGFVALYKGPIEECVSVEYVSQKNFGILKLYNVEGTFRLKLFLEDGILIQQKFLFLINNLASDKPKGLKESLEIFKQIENRVHQDEEDNKILKEIELLSQKLSKKALQSNRYRFGEHTILSNSSSISQNNSGKGITRQIDFTPEYKLISTKIYPIPPKAIFHAFLGDDSSMFKKETSITKFAIFMKKPWRSKYDGKILYRHANIPILINGLKQIIQINQTIETMDDNEYYCFTNSAKRLKFCLGSSFENEFKFIITSINGKKSQIYYYSKINFTNYSIWNPLIRLIIYRINIDQISKFNKRLNTKVINDIGHHGPIVKSIYVYGKLSHTNEPDIQEIEPLVKIGLSVSISIFTKKIINSTNEFIKLIFDIILNILKFILVYIQKNQFLILVIIALTLSNFYFFTRSSINYWTVYRGNTLAEEFIQKNPLLLQRTVYSQDIRDEFFKPLNFDNLIFNNKSVKTNTKSTKSELTQSKPFQFFKDQSFIYNYQNLSMLLIDDYSHTYSERDFENLNNLKNQFKNIGKKRYDLLIELEILNLKENQLLKSNFFEFISNEISKCDYLQKFLIKNGRKNHKNNKKKDQNLIINGKDINLIDGIDNIMGYCSDCKQILNDFV